MVLEELYPGKGIAVNVALSYYVFDIEVSFILVVSNDVVMCHQRKGTLQHPTLPTFPF